jgi:hypothetical protein
VRAARGVVLPVEPLWLGRRKVAAVAPPLHALVRVVVLAPLLPLRLLLLLLLLLLR